MKHNLASLLIASLPTSLVVQTAAAREFHVSTNGNDSNDGSQAAPLRTIQHAADLAQPGDVITVHEGIYRERVNPPRGGTSDQQRITYQAAPGEKVVITGSENIKGWEHVGGDTWKVVLPNKFFGNYNPYADTIHGDWFISFGRLHHPGCVYLNGAWLAETDKLDAVLAPATGIPLWHAKADGAPSRNASWRRRSCSAARRSPACLLRTPMARQSSSTPITSATNATPPICFPAPLR